MNKRKSYKLITVTNRINEHIADYGTDYLKIKELVKSKSAIGNGLMKKKGNIHKKSLVNIETVISPTIG
jgi:peptidyl-prolyl cis-trans isomerase SurA